MLRIARFMLCTCLASAARAQVVTVDEGSFALVRNGERIGREDFSIRSAPSAAGRMFVTQGTVVTGTHRLAPGLNADTAGFPVRYQVEVREDRQVTESYAGQSAGNRYSSRSQRDDGESAREYRLPSGTVAAEDGVIHHLWFVVRRGAGSRVPVLAPRRGTLDTLSVELVGTGRLTIDVREFEARHFRVRGGSDVSIRDIWVDLQGRLLKVSIPSSKFVAVREEGPR